MEHNYSLELMITASTLYVCYRSSKLQGRPMYVYKILRVSDMAPDGLNGKKFPGL